MEKYTDQEFFYKQTPVNYDGIAKFASIKGNTLGWNQLVQNGNFADTSKWTKGSGASSFAISNNEAVITIGGVWNNDIRQNQGASFISGHKYFASFEAKATAPITVALATFNVTPEINFATLRDLQTTFKKIASIVTAQSNATDFRIVLDGSGSSYVGETFTVRNVQIIDLTAMGLDITDPSEFISLFPLSYYSYNQGSLLSFNGNGIKTVGFNQWDEEWELGGLDGNGNNNGNVDRIRSKNFIKVIPNVTYFYHIDSTYGIFTWGYDENKNYVGRIPSNGWAINNSTVKIQSNVSFIRFVVQPGYGTTYKNDICINISSSRNGEYEPYTSSTLSLPISTYFPNGMKSAENVYDELTESKAITRVGAVDLGTLNWSQRLIGTTPIGMQTNGLSATIKNPSTNSDIANIISTAGTASSWTIAMGRDSSSGLMAVSGGYLFIATTETNPTAFKSAMSGVYLYYELATETEADAEDIFYKFYADGTEQLLPVNGSTPSTSYLIADIEYYDSTEGDSLYRRFWLINGDGERWDLTDKEFKSFLNNPTGLGFRKTIEITRYGEKANKNNEVYDFPQPSGELLFYDTYNSTRYDKYNKFIRFLMSQPITLYYMIPVSYISGIANIFTLDCDVTEVQKTESKTDHILTSSIVFNGLGFYEGDEISVHGTTDTYTLTNEGDFPVGFEITIDGSNMETPYITLSQDGELYGEAKFEGSEGTGYGGITFTHVYLNSNDGEQNLELKDQSSALLPNPLNYQDLSISNGAIYVTFIKLAKGVSELSIGMESGSLSSVNIKYSPKYRSV